MVPVVSEVRPGVSGGGLKHCLLLRNENLQCPVVFLFPHQIYFQLQNRIQAQAPYLEVISRALENITVPGSQTEIRSFPLAQLLPDSRQRFFRYNGSLTQPPCSENVVVRQLWITSPV